MYFLLAIPHCGRQDSLRRLESKVETALQLQEALSPELQNSLRSILSECVDARGQSPLSMSAEPAELSAPPTADQLIPPTATSLDLEVKPDQVTDCSAQQRPRGSQ